MEKNSVSQKMLWQIITGKGTDPLGEWVWHTCTIIDLILAVQYIPVYMYLSIPQYISVYYSISQYISVYLSISQYITVYLSISQYITVYLSISQYTSVYLSILQYTSVYLSILQYIPVYLSILQYISVYYSVLLFHSFAESVDGSRPNLFDTQLEFMPPFGRSDSFRGGSIRGSVRGSFRGSSRGLPPPPEYINPPSFEETLKAR